MHDLDAADEQPHRWPLRTAARDIGKLVGVTGALITALVGYGILTAIQGDALTGLLGVIPGAVTAVTAVLASFGVANRGEPLVTPVSDPRDDTGAPLAPRT